MYVSYCLLPILSWSMYAYCSLPIHIHTYIYAAYCEFIHISCLLLMCTLSSAIVFLVLLSAAY